VARERAGEQIELRQPPPGPRSPPLRESWEARPIKRIPGIIARNDLAQRCVVVVSSLPGSDDCPHRRRARDSVERSSAHNGTNASFAVHLPQSLRKISRKDAKSAKGSQG